MKKLIYLVVLLVTICCNNSKTEPKDNQDSTKTIQSNQRSTKADSNNIEVPITEKIAFIDSSLADCYITFGVPSSESDKEWNGDNILFAEILIHDNDGIIYKSFQEHRNAPIGAGHAIFLKMPFKTENKSKIKFNNISKIEVNLTGEHGNSGGYNPHNDQCIFRTEAVLKFNNNKIIATGYNDPAKSLAIGLLGDANKFKLSVKKDNFQNQVTLVEPIN